MARVLVAAAAAAVALAQPVFFPKCLDRYQCIYHATVPPTNGQEYSWDLSQLCRQPGDSEYIAQIGASDQYIAFNICGNTTSMCSYDPATPLYAA